MAISRNKISKSIEPALRIKQRDYTIPIRLNQRLPPSTRLNLTNVSLFSSSTTASNGSRSCGSESRNYALKLKSNQQRSSRQLKVKNMIHPISMKATKRFLPSVLVVVACATLTINTEICLCDTKTSLHSASSSSSTKNRPLLSSAVDYSSNSNLNQKENLLSALSDKIERQHFKMKPARALIQQRPSKFDSAEYLGELNLDAGIDYIKKKAQPLASMKKVDDSMRQILRMHEHAVDTSAGQQVGAMGGLQLGKSPAASSSHHVVATMDTQSAIASPAAKRWRKITQRSPILVNSLNPNKVVSKVLAYVTPLVSSKFQADANILSQSFMLKNSTTYGPRIRLPPFVARSNNQASLGKSILSFRPYTTALPSTSSLIRPDYNKMGSGMHQYSTPPSALMTNNNYKQNLVSGIKSSASSSSSSSVDSIINDLMADSSSITASLDAASAGIASQLSPPLSSSGDEYGKRPDTSSGSKITTTTTSISRQKQPQKGAGSFLKKGANHLAQNYFQNSFRDLITLSQLPILSTSSTSTAPSVFEKKRKPNKVDKVGTTKYRRRRLIEDLYRYAYMLGTGVKNKRDPLEALGSSPNPLIKATNQKSVLSQRSINQLMAANHNQILNYVRKLRSMLTSPMNKAKPRGVMWDMATDPSLAVTVFHLLDRARVALPLGFLLLPVVQMMRHPLNGLNLGRILPAKASHRSVDIEELAKQLDVVDKMLSRALRSTHRESFMGK